MTITSSPPIRTSPIVTTVFSCLNVRLASLYGSVIRSTSCTPGCTSSSCGSPLPLPTAPITVRDDARRSVHVESHLDELRDDRLDFGLRGPFLHHDDHIGTQSRTRSADLKVRSTPLRTLV